MIGELYSQADLFKPSDVEWFDSRFFFQELHPQFLRVLFLSIEEYKEKWVCFYL